MTYCSRIWTMLAVAVLLLVAGTACSQTCLYADFDDDGSPWTLRTGSTNTFEVLRLILEVPPVPPLGETFYITVEEGCCEDFEMIGHYGVSCDYMGVVLDPALVDTFELMIPTCLDCCPWLIWGRFADDAPMVPGERYFIGDVDAYAICEPIPPPPCDPPHDIEVSFVLETGGQCEESSMTLEFYCPGSATNERTWSAIKGLYR